MNATADGVIQIAIQRKASASRGPTLEHSFREVAGLRVKIGRAFTSPITKGAVAEDAVALVERPAALCVPNAIADVGRLGKADHAPQYGDEDQHRISHPHSSAQETSSSEIKIEPHQITAADSVFAREWRGIGVRDAGIFLHPRQAGPRAHNRIPTITDGPRI